MVVSSRGTSRAGHCNRHQYTLFLEALDFGNLEVRVHNVSPLNPRKRFDDQDLQCLAVSLEADIFEDEFEQGVFDLVHARGCADASSSVRSGAETNDFCIEAGWFACSGGRRLHLFRCRP